MTTYHAAPKFVADTHALIWHLGSSVLLSTEARRRFTLADRGDAIIYLSIMSVIEIFYLFEKGKITRSMWELFVRAVESDASSSYQVVDVTYDLVRSMTQVPRAIIAELPDRLIAATAYHLQLPLITKDEKIRQWEGIVSIW